MIQLLHEVLGWLGYLQRPAVLIQILLVLAIVSIKALPSNRQYSKVPRLIPPFIGPGLLFSVFIVLGLLNYPNGLVRFFGMTWLGWGFLKMLEPRIETFDPPSLCARAAESNPHSALHHKCFAPPDPTPRQFARPVRHLHRWGAWG